MNLVRRLVIAASFAALAACARTPPDETPEGALDQYLRAMEETPFDPQASARAFRLLAPAARDAIRARGARAQQLTGKLAPPESMFTPTWTPLRFPVDRTHAVVQPDGAHAIVDVYGVDPQTQHVRVPMIREGEAWRLDVEIPADPVPTSPASSSSETAP